MRNKYITFKCDPWNPWKRERMCFNLNVKQPKCLFVIERIANFPKKQMWTRHCPKLQLNCTGLCSFMALLLSYLWWKQDIQAYTGTFVSLFVNPYTTLTRKKLFRWDVLYVSVRSLFPITHQRIKKTKQRMVLITKINQVFLIPILCVFLINRTNGKLQRHKFEIYIFLKIALFNTRLIFSTKLLLLLIEFQHIQWGLSKWNSGASFWFLPQWL